MGLLQVVNRQYYGLARPKFVAFSSLSSGLPEHNAGGWVLPYLIFLSKELEKHDASRISASCTPVYKDAVQ